MTDLSVMRALPNMTVVCPADLTEAQQVVKAAAEHLGLMVPVGIHDRFGETGSYPELLEENGLTAGHIARAAIGLLERKKNALNGGRR